ncbi:DoxX family protein [Streptomyces sp. HSW2009]|uniref:DoxX family protein n=1 Tax=Streptomyces sp. HSW2009 TaxID=3142890 RepID=UPI0032EDCA5A
MSSPNPLNEHLDAARPYATSLFRIVVGLLFACHGAKTLFGSFGGVDGAGGTIDAGTWPGWHAAVIQLIGGILVMTGLFTRSAAFISSGSMAYAYFVEHQSEKLWPIENGGEASAMFCWAFLIIIFTGPGAWALDRFIGAGRTQSASEPHRQPTRV